MCFYCCCSCCCNKFSAKCVEFTTLIFSFLSIICLIIATILIKKVHISDVSFAMLITLIVFFFLFIISITIIIIWRKKCLINTTKNGGGICLTKLCLAFSIIGMIIIIIWFAITRNSLYKTDHPCSEYSKPMTYDNETNTIYFRLLELSEEMEKFCGEIDDKSYYANICNFNEYLCLYIISPIVFLFAMILTCLWHNDSQRISNRVDACLPTNTVSKVSRMSLGRFNINPNILINDNSQRKKIIDRDPNNMRPHRGNSNKRCSVLQRDMISSYKGGENRKSISYSRVNDSSYYSKRVFGFNYEQNNNNGNNDNKYENNLNVINE